MKNQMISHFKIISKLGEGGMGVVYKAEDTRLERIVALKFLPGDVASEAEVKKRFEIEAKAAAALNHPNIATIHQIEEADGELFIVMEFVEGQELRQLIRASGALPADEAINYASQIAEGLQAAHDKGVVHRDIKSSNIMLTDSGQIKIMDFGLAKKSGRSQVTKEGTTLGTMAYMSPEQAQGQDVDHRSDIWSYGVVLYEMLSGHLPFSADYEMALIYAILNEEPAPVAALQKHNLQALQKVLDQALSKDLQVRYQQVSDVLKDLSAISGVAKAGFVRRVPERHMVGREKEIALLQKGVENAFSGQSQIIAIAGEAGIGKTTVVEEFLDDLIMSSKPCLIAQGQCSERLAGAEAYLPFLETLTSLLQLESDIAIARIMREIAPWWFVQVASLSPDDPANAAILADVRNATQERVKRELVTFLQDISSQRTLIIFIEDLHWADVSSIDMIAYLAPKFDAMRLLIATTYRPGDMRLSEHAFLQIKPDLLSRGQCREVALDFLPQPEIENYLALEFPGHRFPGSFVELIHNRTEGSPLFMVDLLQDLSSRGVIAEEQKQWQLTQAVEEIKLELPDSVKGMIERKIKQLNEPDHQLMTAACIQGFEFDSAVVGQLLDLDEEQVEERLQKLEKDHRFVQFLEEDEFPDRTLTLRYRFVHALYQNELYAELTRTKRTRLSRKAAEALEQFHGEKTEKVAAALASLHETARDFDKAIGYLEQAAIHATGLFAYREAIELTQHGFKLLEETSDPASRDKRELDLQIILGSCATAVYGYANETVRNTYLRIHELIDDDEESVDVILSTFGLHSFYLSTLKMEEAVDLCRWYIELAQQQSNDTLMFSGEGIMGVTRSFMGDFETGRQHLMNAMRVYDPQMDEKLAFVSGQDVVLAVNNNYPWNLWLAGYPDQAIARSAHAAKLAEKRSDPHVLTHRFVFAGFLYICLRDVKEVQRLAETNIQISTDHVLPWPLTIGNLQRGWALCQIGKAEEGLNAMYEGLAMFEAMGFSTWAQVWHAEMAATYGRIGAPDKGLELIAESMQVVENTAHRIWRPELHRVKGELLLQKGTDASQVESSYQMALETAREQEGKSFELRAAMSLARLWQSQNKQKQAQDLLHDVYNWFTEGFETRDLKEAKALLDELS